LDAEQPPHREVGTRGLRREVEVHVELRLTASSAGSERIQDQSIEVALGEAGVVEDLIDQDVGVVVEDRAPELDTDPKAAEAVHPDARSEEGEHRSSEGDVLVVRKHRLDVDRRGQSVALGNHLMVGASHAVREQDALDVSRLQGLGDRWGAC
jgi:hypothetical protein